MIADAVLFWTATSAILAAILVALTVWLVAQGRRPRTRFRTAIDDKGDEARLSLFRTDGAPVAAAICRITKWRRTVRECLPGCRPITSARATFTYPGDFESLFIDGVLDKGRYAVVWEARRRNRRTGLMERKRVARARFQITDDLWVAAQRLREWSTFLAGSVGRFSGGMRLSLIRIEEPIRMVQCEVRQRRADGSLAAAYAGDADARGVSEVALDFPAEFRREIRQTRWPTPGGGFQTESDYEDATGEPGNYEVLWKAVWYETGGTFDPDHEITVEDFRREVEVAQHRFQIVD